MFVVEKGIAIKRTVASVKSGGNDLEIRKGLSGGEILIISPPDTLQDGAAVKTVEAKS